MTEITPNLTVGDIIRSGQYGEFADYIFTDMTPDHWNNQLSAYGYETTGIEKALYRMQELASDGEEYIHYIYGDEERMANWDKKKVCLLHFPGPVKNRPYVLIIPGGALNRQWGLIEGQAIAAKINELGYSAFVLFYRTKQEPVMDKALEDMYKAIQYIEAKAGYFHVIPGRYILGGFQPVPFWHRKLVPGIWDGSSRAFRNQRWYFWATLPVCLRSGTRRGRL